MIIPLYTGYSISNTITSEGVVLSFIIASKYLHSKEPAEEK
jgi:hypothetical protein